MGMSFEDFLGTWEFLRENTERFRKMSYASMGALVCMIIEEWCDANNEDPVEIAKNLEELVKEVRKEDGGYRHD